MPKHLPVLGALLLALACLPASAAERAVESPAPGAPATKTYALVAAVGARYGSVYEVQQTGSHLPPFRRGSATATGNVLNKIVLSSLDREVAAADPSGRRVLMSLDPAWVDAANPAKREEAAISTVVAALEAMPERARWSRILVVTPAYAALERDGLATSLVGLGLFFQPLCASRDSIHGPSPCQMRFRPPSGPEALTPQGTVEPANHFVAPYSYLAVWVLDPATLLVLERREVFGHEKLYDHLSDAQNIQDKLAPEFLARRAVAVIEGSVRNAFAQTELAGHAELGEIREVKPPPAGAPAKAPKRE